MTWRWAVTSRNTSLASLRSCDRMHANLQAVEHHSEYRSDDAERPLLGDLPTDVSTRTARTVQYVVGSQSQRWVEFPWIRTGWHLGSAGRRVPDGLRHALDVDVMAAACGVPASVLFVSRIFVGRRCFRTRCAEPANAPRVDGLTPS